MSNMNAILLKVAAVLSFAAAFLASFKQLDVLINNAGIYGGGAKTTAEGFSMSMGVNHLGHFATLACYTQRSCCHRDQRRTQQWKD